MAHTAIAASATIGRILLVSNDPATIEQFKTPMHQLALHSEVCVEVPAALRLLGREKFEAVIIDLLLGEVAHSILAEVRISDSNRTAVTFAIVRNQSESAEAFKSGSSFVLERPVTNDSISRVLKAAYGLIVRERRRYFRCPVAVSSELRRPNLGNVRCQTLNVSEGGMAMTAPEPVAVRPGSLVAVHFQLPNRHYQFALQSFICWANEQGRIGVEFASPSGIWKAELQEWLLERLEDSLPESVAEKFRRAIAHQKEA